MSRRSERSEAHENGSQASSYVSRRPTINFQELLEELPEPDRETGERLRRHLQFFFMNPMEKWKVRKQLPYKLFLQVLKIVFVTLQLILFAEMRMSHVDFMEDTTTVMRHRFLKDWNDDRDALQYPPAEGRYSVYDDKGLNEHLSFIITSYYGLQNDSFASFSYDMKRSMMENDQDNNVSLNAAFDFNSIPFIEVHIDRISNVTVNNHTYDFDVTEVKELKTLNLTSDEVSSIGASDDNVRDILAKKGVTFLPEDSLKYSTVTFKFILRTIHYSPTAGDQKPECYKIVVSIKFDNSRHTGQVHVTLKTVVSYESVCNGRIIKGVGWSTDALIIGGTDIVVLILCFLSFVLCCRALIKAHLLQSKTSDYFENVLKTKLTVSDHLDFLNLWYLMIVINDILIILGTVAKISIEFRDFDNSLFTLTSIFLGMGALMVYVGVLRYFGFFSQYNILILTLKKSLPNIMRFMSCAIVLYAGFLIAGWVIIGPYSMKFRTLAESSEALFSLLNGDDMFATFYTINDSNTSIKVFGTIYIYMFVSLFIYVVLSLFIAIIMDAYEVVKDRYSDGLRMSEQSGGLKDFVNLLPPPSELSSPTVQAAYAPSNLLNLAAGNDSSRALRALNAIDNARDWFSDLRNGTRFQSFSNPLNDSSLDISNSQMGTAGQSQQPFHHV